MQIRRTLASLLTGPTLACALAWPAFAQDIFTVKDLPVDQTADTAAAARKAALDGAHLRAMEILMRRLVLTEDLDLLPPLTARQVEEYVRNFEVDDERTSTVRYLARLTFQFNNAAVRNYLRGQGVRFTDVAGPPVLLLPVYGSAEQTVLWEDPNPWRNAWANRDNSAGLVPILVPLGDLEDISAGGAADALDPDNPRLQPLAERYGTRAVVTAQAVLNGDPGAGGASLQVVNYRSGVDPEERARVLTIRQNPGEDFRQLLARATETVAEEINDNWKRSSRLRFENQGQVLVQVPISSLGAWIEVKRRLEKVPAVEKTTLIYLSTDSAQLQLNYFGDVDQLSRSLTQNDLQLTEPGFDGGARQLLLIP